MRGWLFCVAHAASRDTTLHSQASNLGCADTDLPKKREKNTNNHSQGK